MMMMMIFTRHNIGHFSRRFFPINHTATDNQLTNTGWAKKTDHFYTYTVLCITTYREAFNRYQNVQLFISILNGAIFKYSLHKFRETILQRKYQFKHDVQPLHTIPSKSTIIADYEHQSVNSNSTCLLC